MTRGPRFFTLPLVHWVLRRRFVKFGTVGASGVAVNLALLYVSQEHLFAFIHDPSHRLDASLAVAISGSTLSNFLLNRRWTWGDRRHHHGKHILVQFAQYALACWLGIVLQVFFTKLLAVHFHYMAANLVAIVLASVFNFAMNDAWTFGGLRALSARRAAGKQEKGSQCN